MKFASLRRLLFQIHMWVGLLLGVFLVVVSLSGAILVYDDKLANFFAAAPKATTAGQRLPLSMLIDSARNAAMDKGAHGAQAQILLPQDASEAAIVRFTGGSAMAGMSMTAPVNGVQVYVDPVSGAALGMRPAGLLPVFAFIHRLHGSLALGRDVGRPIVGWLGVAMLVLGISGLVLWWPKRGQWKYAFLVRSTATGLRFHRELHAAAGIWTFIVFMAVSFSGVAITFPQTVRAIVAPGSQAPRPAFNLREGPSVTVVEGAKPVSPDGALLAAQKLAPDAMVGSITMPTRPTQAISVGMASRFGTTATVYVNPYTGAVMATRDPANAGGADSFMALQRPLHDGQGNFGPVWEFLVFVAGLVPTLFVVTGVIMWLKKRKRHIPMSTLSEDVADDPA